MKLFIIFFLFSAVFIYSQNVQEGDLGTPQPPVKIIIPLEPPPIGQVTQRVEQDLSGDQSLSDAKTNMPQENPLENPSEPGTETESSEGIALEQPFSNPKTETTNDVAEKNEIPLNIIPGLPDLNSNKVFKVQVGAYKNNENAQRSYDTLKSACFNPEYEQIDDICRVIICNVKASDIPAVASRLAAAGFSEILLREVK